MDYLGTSGNDRIDQDAQGLADFLFYYGGAGNDVIRVRNGVVCGGPGNDTLEVVGNAFVPLIYPDSPGGVTVDLAGGFALDGFGTRDTLVGNFSQINASGFDDRLLGNALDNLFATGGGRDYVDGRGGVDAVMLGRQEEFAVRTSPDGRSAWITFSAQGNRQIELRDVEFLLIDQGPNEMRLAIADFIDPYDLGAQGLTGRDTQRWNAGSPKGTEVALTYSFATSAPASGPGATGFRAYTPVEKAVVRELLAATAGFCGLSFREVSDSPEAQLRFGISQQTSTKGMAYAPDQGSTAAGDVWMDVDSVRDLTVGSEGRAALLHEVGHALGLRHPRNVDAGDAYEVQLRTVDDSTTLSAMASAAAPSGLFRGDWGPLDVIALRSLYSSKPVHEGNDIYRFGIVAALVTVIDDNGIDTLDASAANLGAKIDLRAGRLSSIGRTAEGLAAVDNVGVTAGSLIEHAIGTAFDDLIIGNATANRLTGGLGNDQLRGGDGIDTAVYDRPFDQLDITRTIGGWQVADRNGRGGIDELETIERLQASDRCLAMDISGSPTQTVQLIGALFGKAYLEPALVGIGIGLFDSGLSMPELAGLALQLELVVQLAGSRSHADLVRLLYRNVMGVVPSAADAAPFQALLDQGTLTPAQLVVMAAQHPLNDLQIDLVGLAGHGIEFIPG